MKMLWIIVAAILLQQSAVVAQSKYTTTKGVVSFFAEAPISNVDARNEKAKVELTSDGELTFDMAMSDFVFKNGKMGRDAQKKYLETEKYTTAGFKGKIQGKVDYDKPGTYNVTATGKLKIHGVEKNVTEKGAVVVVKEGSVELKSEFNVALADYHIDTPEILGKKMTAEKVQVKIDAKLAKGTKDVASKTKTK